jgi:hypothetical protein
MKWKEKGLIYCPDSDYDWMLDRAMVPVCRLVSDHLLRIYFSVRDKNGRSTPIYLDSEPSAPEKVKRIAGIPILSFGKPGTFDDNGITISSIVQFEGLEYVYYIGWNPRITVAYHLSIGLAIGPIGGPYKKHSEGPILDRSVDEPYFSTAPFVMIDDKMWKMWYVSCNGWKSVDNRLEPVYNVKYCTSFDGINWRRTGITCIENDGFAEAVGKPFVYKENDLFCMIYSYRGSQHYRTDPMFAYRLGYAESFDGVTWIRSDSKLQLPKSTDKWDSIMREYASSYVHDNKRYLVYNGNGFGKTGFGYAVQEA